MAEANAPMPTPEDAAPTLSTAALAELAPFGEERPVEAGEILFRAGDPSYDFMVILEGEIDIVRPDRESESVLATWGAGQFLGELNMLTGQRLFLTARVRRSGRILVIPVAEFRRVMAIKPDVADVIFSAFFARRERLRMGEGARAVRIVGS
jgi:thioredoxin reductase (NADPH)